MLLMPWVCVVAVRQKPTAQNPCRGYHSKPWGMKSRPDSSGRCRKNRNFEERKLRYRTPVVATASALPQFRLTPLLLAGIFSPECEHRFLPGYIPGAYCHLSRR